MSADYFMAVKSIGLSQIGGRKPCTLAVAAKHNKRELAQELEERGRIYPERTRLNYSIAGAIDSGGVVAMALQLMESIGTSPEQKRHDYCQAIEIVFSLPANTTIDIKRYFADCSEWCCARFGDEKILSVDVHLDESTPHCHALIAPIQSGRWIGCKVIDRTNTKAMSKSFSKQVASVYGLKMVESLKGKRKGDAVAMVLAYIESHDRGLLQSPARLPLRQAEGKRSATPLENTFKESPTDKGAYLFPVDLEGALAFIHGSALGSRVQVGLAWDKKNEWIYFGSVKLSESERNQLTLCLREALN